MLLNALCILSVAGVVVTKAADLWTTWRHVSADSETNPVGRFLFRRIGVGGGIVVVGALALLLIAASWWAAIAMGPAGMIFLAAWSLVISVVQAGVAHHNATGRPNLVTRRVAALHSRWSHWLLSRRAPVARRAS